MFEASQKRLRLFCLVMGGLLGSLMVPALLMHLLPASAPRVSPPVAPSASLHAPLITHPLASSPPEEENTHPPSAQAALPEESPEHAPAPFTPRLDLPVAAPSVLMPEAREP